MLELRFLSSKLIDLLILLSDPNQWSEDDVMTWIVWNLRQYNLPVATAEYFSMPGATLVQLTEEEFQQRAPQVIIIFSDREY